MTKQEWEYELSKHIIKFKQQAHAFDMGDVKVTIYKKRTLRQPQMISKTNYFYSDGMKILRFVATIVNGG